VFLENKQGAWVEKQSNNPKNSADSIIYTANFTNCRNGFVRPLGLSTCRKQYKLSYQY